ncbi:MAG: polymer-forming cytoskeletal protein [Oscillospiraceae bacterium]|nr:polymer-forming cytoskeletal protein [Oscillospiraceae bacterium]
MFKKQNGEKLYGGITAGTVIAKGVSIEAGEISGAGNILIEGVFKGNISIDGDLVVGSSGDVSGDVKARSAMFAGIYSGSVNVDGAIRFCEGSRVKAQVEATKIIMDEGAIFDGYITSAKIYQEEAKI